MNIKEYLDILKDLWTPTNASKIRMSISNALEMMGNNLKENIDRQDNVENQFQDVLDETTGKDVINGPEIIAARNGETNLKARLDKEKNEVTAQLAQIEQDKANKEDLEFTNQKVTGLQNLLKGLKLSDVQEPLYIAHRGAMNIFPESSIEAYGGCVDLGLNVIEMDVRMSVDGALIVHHDNTMDRTTNRTGNVSEFTSIGFKNAKIDSLIGWEGTPVLFEDLLREFGNKVIYVPEIKDERNDTAQKVVDAIVKYNMEENCIIQSFNLPNLDYAKSLRIPVMYLSNNADPIDIANQGIEYIGVSVSSTDQYITDCINAGLKVVVYTVNRRYQRDHLLGLGVHGFFSDDPMWISGLSPRLPYDTFKEKVYTHGMISPPAGSGLNVQGNRGAFYDNNRFGWVNALGFARDFSLQGWAGALPNKFNLKFVIAYDKLSTNDGRWASIVLCTPKDIYADNSADSSGYHVLFRANGTMSLYRTDNGVATLLQESTGSPITEGASTTIFVTINDTSVIVTRGSQTVRVEDNTYRNGYLHVGRYDLGVTFGGFELNEF